MTPGDVPSWAPSWAIVRGIPDSYARALGQIEGAAAIDVGLARAQHAAYCRILRGLGLEVVALPTDEALPDCCFVEDTAVVAAGRALLTRPGAPERQAEVEAVGEALAGRVEVVRAGADARLDGGDVLRVGRTIYVGQSARTDASGLGAVRAAFEPLGFAVVAVPLPAGQLHLKCYATALGDGAVVVAEGAWPGPAFGPEITVVTVPAAEAYAANVLAVGRTVIMAAGYEAAARVVAARGVTVVPTPTTELAKAAGSLTCLSILG